MRGVAAARTLADPGPPAGVRQREEGMGGAAGTGRKKDRSSAGRGREGGRRIVSLYSRL